MQPDPARLKFQLTFAAVTRETQAFLMSLTLRVSNLESTNFLKSALSKISLLTSTWTPLDLNGIDMSPNPKLISKSKKQSMSIQTFSRT